MGELQPDGATKRDHCESVFRQTGRMPGEAEGDEVPQCPEELEYLWRYFDSMSLRRQYGEAGPQAISSEAVLDWASAHGVELSSWEVEVLDSIEHAVLSFHREKMREKLNQLGKAK